MTTRIKVPGPGSRNCLTPDRITRAAVAELGLDATVAKVQDYRAIVDYSLMSTPALVIDERLVVGRSGTRTSGPAPEPHPGGFPVKNPSTVLPGAASAIGNSHLNHSTGEPS